MFDINELLEYMVAEGKVKRMRPERNGNIQITCPFPHYRVDGEKFYEKQPSMGVLVEPPYFVNCFACGERMNIEGLVAHLLEINLLDAVRWLEKRYEYDGDYQRKLESKVIRALPVYEEFFGKRTMALEFPEAMFADFRQVHSYILDRGFSLEIALKYELGYDKSQHRVVFPIRNLRGGLVGAIGRAIDPEQSIKYLIYWNFVRGNTLYRNRGSEKKDKVIVVESALDVPWAEQLGLCEEYDVIAIMSSKITAVQADGIAGYAEVISALDNDYAGKTGTELLLRYLSNRTKVSVLSYPQGKKDLGECTREEMDKALAERKVWFEVLVKELKPIID